MGMAIEIEGHGGALMVVLSGTTNHEALGGLIPALAAALAEGGNVIVDVRTLMLDGAVRLDDIFATLTDYGTQFQIIGASSCPKSDRRAAGAAG